MDVRLEWLGCATFRLTVGETVLFLDSYIDRVEGAPPVGLSVADVDRADYVLVGHSHFDHLWGADRIALQTGATVVGSYETARFVREAGVPRDQTLAVSGGEPLQLGEHVRVRVFPSLHSCTWCGFDLGDPAERFEGDLGVPHHERVERLSATTASFAGAPEVLAHVLSGPHAEGDGGPLVYLIETPEGSILWQDTSGRWAGLFERLRPDVAILAAAARANDDGEPVQGSLVDFVTAEVDQLRPRRVVLCHHDDWMPPATSPVPVEPFAAALADRPVELVELEYLDSRPILAGL